MRVAPPQAWVARSMVIPKAGENSVGVERQFLPYTGQVLNAQYAVGVWAASEAGSFPVNWRLHLSDAWLEDGARRTQASARTPWRRSRRPTASTRRTWA
ncbi:Transposase OS=Streptomyces microflavus OX=1919 GN=G3I39_33305 PE=4 SV=1 [Streptomyces microflavus]